MEPARATWTDERLDDFRRAVDERFDQVDLELRTQRSEIRSGHSGLTGGIDRLAARLDALHTRIDALQRTVIHVGLAQVASLLVILITALVTRG